MSSSLSPRGRIKIVLLFTLAGPVLGGLPLLIPLMIAGLISAFSGSGSGFPGFIAFAFSYVIGFVPGALCGLIYQWIAVRLSTLASTRTKLQTFVVGMLAGTISGLLAVCFFFFLRRENVTLYFVILFCSMFSGALCALIARRWTEKNPTKPNPAPASSHA